MNFRELSGNSSLSTFDIYFQYTTICSYWDSSYTEIDTIDSYFQIIGIDTVRSYVTDTTEIFLFDSTSTIQTDTLNKNKKHKFTNKFKYIEVPILTGYSFQNGAFCLNLKCGIITSFLRKSYGNYATGSSEEDIFEFTRDNFPFVRFDLYTAAELRFLVGGRYFLFGEAFYRKSLNKLLLNDLFKTNYSACDLRPVLEFISNLAKFEKNYLLNTMKYKS